MKVSIFNTLEIKAIRQYQTAKKDTPVCLHVPCCSDYAILAFHKYSFLKAARLTYTRIKNCQPHSKVPLNDYP